MFLIWYFFFQLQGSSVDEEEDQEIDPESQSPEGQNNHQSQKDGQNLDDSGQASGTGMSRFQKDCLHLLTFSIYFDGWGYFPKYWDFKPPKLWLDS